MKKIKFRGRRIDAEEYVYGDLVQFYDRILVNGYTVEPNSVAQFIGYDRNGKEFYSDDKLREYDSFDYCEGIMPADESFYFYEIGKTFKSLELVEEND